MPTKKEYKTPYTLILIGTIVLLVLGAYSLISSLIFFPMMENFYESIPVEEDEEFPIEMFTGMFQKI